jgi:hypothetical protein
LYTAICSAVVVFVGLIILGCGIYASIASLVTLKSDVSGIRIVMAI